MIVVSNSTPLIALAGIGRFNLLKNLYGKIYIPTAVYNDVVSFGTGRPGEVEVRDSPWIEKKDVHDRLAVDILTSRLGKGESESLVLSKELNVHLVLLDEEPAREEAEILGLNKTGTLGVLLLAKRRGLIHEVKGYVNQLKGHDFRMGTNLYVKVLRLAKEG